MVAVLGVSRRYSLLLIHHILVSALKVSDVFSILTDWHLVLLGYQLFDIVTFAPVQALV